MASASEHGEVAGRAEVSFMEVGSQLAEVIG